MGLVLILEAFLYKINNWKNIYFCKWESRIVIMLWIGLLNIFSHHCCKYECNSQSMIVLPDCPLVVVFWEAGLERGFVYFFNPSNRIYWTDIIQTFLSAYNSSPFVVIMKKNLCSQNIFVVCCVYRCGISYYSSSHEEKCKSFNSDWSLL